MTSTQQGYLLIADITGYTMYLSTSELEHAEKVLEALLKLLIDHTRPPLRISRLEGDAVISYSLPGIDLQGQTFVEMIEDTYVSFRRLIDLMVMNNTCRCNACTNISALDLKFFIHYGTFAIQNLGAQDELVGSDVNMIHRLLKNNVRDKTGVRAYTLYTGAAINQLGLEGFTASLISHQEVYEHLGSIDVWIQDMQPVWLEKRNAVQISLPPEQVNFEVAIELSIAPALVWDYIIDPEYVVTFYAATAINYANRSHGRIDKDSIIQCFHGDHISPLTIVQWQPMEQIMTMYSLVILGMNVTCLNDLRLVQTPGGTRLVESIGKAKGGFPARIMADMAMSKMKSKFRTNLDAFASRIEEDFKARKIEMEVPQLAEQAIEQAASASLSLEDANLLP